MTTAALEPFARALGAHDDLEIALPGALRACAAALGVRRHALYRVDGAGLRVQRTDEDASAPANAHDAWIAHEATLRAILAGGDAVRLPSLAWADGAAVLAASGCAAGVLVPLVHRKRTLGGWWLAGTDAEIAAVDWSDFARGSARIVAQTLAITTMREQPDVTTNDAALAAADLMMSIGTLASGLAHEINSPLAAVMANLEIAHRLVTDDASALEVDELTEVLGDARAAADRVREIVRDLRLFSRAFRDDGSGAVNVHDVLESTLRLTAYELRHRARVERSFGDIPPVVANEGRLGQVLLNLVVNAAHAIPEGDVHTHRLRIATRLGDDGRVVVSIGDTGIGMTPDVRSHLFVPFFTTKPIGVGTGLGLPTCQRLMTAMGGTIEVETEQGKGTTVTLTLPAARLTDPPSPPTRDAPAATPARARGRVLVIDDEPMVGAAVRRTLALAHDVTPVVRATDALALIRAGEVFDVVLCDLLMPQTSGMAFYDALAETHPAWLERIVFLTGGAFTQRAREFLDRVPNMRVEKPFDPQQLRNVVSTLIRR